METKIFIPSTHNNVYRQGGGYLDQQRAATQNGTKGHDWRSQGLSDHGYQVLRTQSPKCLIPSKPATKQGHSIATKHLNKANYGRDEFEGVARITDGDFDPRSSSAYGVIRLPGNTKTWLVHQSHVPSVNQTSSMAFRSNALAASSSPIYSYQLHDTTSQASGREKPISADGFYSEVSPFRFIPEVQRHQAVTWRPCSIDAVLEPVQIGIDSTIWIRRSEKPTVYYLCETTEPVNKFSISPETERQSSHKDFSFNGARRFSSISVPRTMVTNAIRPQEACHPPTNVSYLYPSSDVRPISPIFNRDHHYVHHPQLVTQKEALCSHVRTSDVINGLTNPHHDYDIEVAHQAREERGLHSRKGHGKTTITDRQVTKDQQVRQRNSAFTDDCRQPARYHTHPNDNTSRHKAQAGYAVTENTVSSGSKYTRTFEGASAKNQRLGYYTAGRYLASDQARCQRLTVDDRCSTKPPPQPEMPPVSLALDPNSFPYQMRPFYVSVNAEHELASYVVNLEAALRAGGEKRKEKKKTEKVIAGHCSAVPPTENPSYVVPSNSDAKKDVLSSIRLERVYYSVGGIPTKATSTTRGQVNYTRAREPQHTVVEKDEIRKTTKQSNNLGCNQVNQGLVSVVPLGGKTGRNEDAQATPTATNGKKEQTAGFKRKRTSVWQEKDSSRFKIICPGTIPEQSSQVPYPSSLPRYHTRVILPGTIPEQSAKVPYLSNLPTFFNQ